VKAFTTLVWGYYVPKMATLFIHLLTNVKKEIMLKNLGSAGDSFTVEMLLLKYLVYICPVTTHLLSKPFNCSTLFVEYRFDNMSYVYLRHLSKKIS